MTTQSLPTPPGLTGEKSFRWRGRAQTRLESFSNAVFGFAVTLLVVASEVPQTFGQLEDAMGGFIAFGLCFAVLVMLWHYQASYFRRYGINDALTVVLTATLLFLVLFYVYPLKFLATLIVEGLMGNWSVVLPDGSVVPRMLQGESPRLMLIYSGGYFVIFALFAVMYYRAYHFREALQLNRDETFVTKLSVQNCVIQAVIGLLSILIAWLIPPSYAPLSGFVYFLIGPSIGLNVWLQIRKHRREAPPGVSPDP